MTDTPNRPPLSPAAQAVLDHFLSNVEISVDHGIAAALRAAAYQVAPAKPHLESCCKRREAGVRHKLLAIAAELEAPRSLTSPGRSHP